MAPSKPRAGPDDSRSEASSTREKPGAASTGTLNPKGRRTTNASAGGSSLRELANVGAGPSSNANTSANGTSQEANLGMQWSTMDTSTLHAYRHVYGLDTPSAFSNEYNYTILSRPGIGSLSPTMVRKKHHKRQSKEQLTNAVRKHFNGLGIQENEAIVDFLYKVRWQDKTFRMRFAPQRSK